MPSEIGGNYSRTYVAVLESGSFTVGQTNALSGLFIAEEEEDAWVHRGWKNVRCFGVTVRRGDESHILLACGNGVHESTNAGTSWRVLTDWRITEVLDVSFDPNDPRHLIGASAYGIFHSLDGGLTWKPASDGLTTKFVQTLSAPPTSDLIWAGTEDGVFVTSATTRLSWRRDGINGFAIRQIETSSGGVQIAATRNQGAWIRSVGGPWTRIRGVPSDATCYSVAIHPRDARTIAVGGLFKGVYVTRDGGRTASHFATGGPDSPVHALAFGADDDGLLVGTTDQGLFRVRNGSWAPAGLPNTSVRRILSA